MMIATQEKRLKNALPDFVIYHKAKWLGDDVEVVCGLHEDTVKTIRSGKDYTGEFIVFPESAICRVLSNAYVQTKPELWGFIEEDGDESY